MYTYIMVSLSEQGRNKVANLQEKYTVLGIKSGLLLYKIVTQKAVVDNRATVTHLRQSLMNLDTYITSCGSNIELFNRCVQSLQRSLHARGQRYDNLILHLFKGYEVTSDVTFQNYIKEKRDKYEDEGLDLAADELIVFAENKYHTLKRDDR